MKRKLISAILFCLYLGAVAVLCFIRGEQLPDMPSTWLGIPMDKLAHILMFIPFPLLSYQVFYPYKTGPAGKLGMLSVFTLVGAGVALGTEKIQEALQYRTYEVLDLAADSIGLIIGAVFCAVFILIESKRDRR